LISGVGKRLGQSSSRRSSSSTSDSQRISACCGNFAEGLDGFFKISERNSTICTEIRAGTVTFLTMAYIVLVNPQVLHESGIPRVQAAAATCIASCVSSLIAGLLGNLPFGCAPGVGLSAYFAYGLVLRHDTTDSVYPDFRRGLTCCFLAGCICLFFWVTTISRRIMNGIPEFIKISTIVGMGLFLSFVGMWNIRLVTQAPSGTSPVELGNLGDWQIWLSIITLILITLLSMYDIKGYLLIGVVLSAIVWFAATGLWPESVVSLPAVRNPMDCLHFATIDKGMVIGIVSFILILIFDVSGVVYAVGDICGLMNSLTGTVEGGVWALFAASVGTMLAASLGCSPIIVHLESAAGAIEGGRTGLTAVTIAFWFGLSTFLAPLFGAMPMASTAPVLIFIGTLMIKQTSMIKWDRMEIAVPSFLTIAMMPFTFSIANGIFFGLGTYLIIWVCTGEFMFPIFGISGWAPDKDDFAWEDEEADVAGADGGTAEDPRSDTAIRVAKAMKTELGNFRDSVEREMAGQLDGLFGQMEFWFKRRYECVMRGEEEPTPTYSRYPSLAMYSSSNRIQPTSVAGGSGMVLATVKTPTSKTPTSRPGSRARSSGFQTPRSNFFG